MNQPTRTCQKCGASLADDARFCEECGNPVVAAAAAKKPLLPFLLAAGLVAIVIFGCLITLAVRQFTKPPANPTQVGFFPAETQVGTGEVSPTTTVSAAIIATEVSAPTGQIEPAPPEPSLPAPADTPVPAASEPQPGWYDFEGVAFSYDPTLAALIETVTFDPQTENDLPPWELYPEHRVLSFRGYPLSGTFNEPKITIYPAEEYLAINPAIGDQVANLQQMLIGKRTDFLPSALPFFTIWNAGQMLASQVKYLDFKNGSGVRYLTQYGQGIHPIDNQQLFYTFQGITRDQKWLISAILPVNNSVLPDPNTLLNEPGFSDDYAAYIDKAKILLDELPDTSYVPNLTLLDSLFQSLEIKR